MSTNQNGKAAAESGNGEGEGETMARGAWGGKVEFILTCIGYAVGLGNVWRFPYLTYKSGGGAFLIPFILMLFLIGIPLFFMELCFGQFASLGPIEIWRANPLMKGLGFSMVFTNLMVALYYNVIISWCLYFLFASMTDKLPWESCDNYWNTPYCYIPDYNRTVVTTAIPNYTTIAPGFTTDNTTAELIIRKSPSEEYFYRKVLQMSDGIHNSGEIVWQLALCLLLCWMLVFIVLVRGISSLGKVVYFTSTFPYLLLTIMLVRGVTLEGAWTGLEFYLIPDWERLGDLQVWSDAATQIFYALSACTGGLIAMASYNQFNNNTLRDSLIVPIVNVCTSFYAGFVIFSVLGFMAESKGVKVEDVAAAGPGLVFVVYPEGLSQMPVAPLWSILFFIMMMMLGLSSMFSMAETFFSGFMDQFPGVLRKTYYHTVAFRAAGCLCFYLISLPMITNGGFYVFTIWDAYTGGFPLLIIGFVELITLTYLYGYKNFAYDIEMMLGKPPGIVFRVAWSVVSPAILFAVIIITAVNYSPPVLFAGSYDEYHFPGWAEGIGWLIVTGCVIFIPALFIYRFYKTGEDVGYGLHTFKEAMKPLPSWGPADSVNRTGKYAKEQASAYSIPPAYDGMSFPMSEGGVVNAAYETDLSYGITKT